VFSPIPDFGDLYIFQGLSLKVKGTAQKNENGNKWAKFHEELIFQNIVLTGLFIL
jgi:hypothetical protein